MKTDKCRYCEYPLETGIAAEDIQGNKATICRNCGNVNMIATPTLGKLCPKCSEPMENYRGGGRVFLCGKCKLFSHDEDIFYATSEIIKNSPTN